MTFRQIWEVKTPSRWGRICQTLVSWLRNHLVALSFRLVYSWILIQPEWRFRKTSEVKGLLFFPFLFSKCLSRTLAARLLRHDSVFRTAGFLQLGCSPHDPTDWRQAPREVLGILSGHQRWLDPLDPRNQGFHEKIESTKFVNLSRLISPLNSNVLGGYNSVYRVVKPHQLLRWLSQKLFGKPRVDLFTKV